MVPAPVLRGRPTATKAGETQVASAPLQKIVGEGKNMKYVNDCKELHLGNERIEVLRDFDSLANLEILFLNDNYLRTVTGLESNFRLRRLYLMNNDIVTVKGSIGNMFYLELLDLSNNNLRNLSKVLKGLEHLRFIQNLSLNGNPCCEEAWYRQMCIQTLPSLHILDFHVVTESERIEALKPRMMQIRKTGNNEVATTGVAMSNAGDNEEVGTQGGSELSETGGRGKRVPKKLISPLERLKREIDTRKRIAVAEQNSRKGSPNASPRKAVDRFKSFSYVTGTVQRGKC